MTSDYYVITSNSSYGDEMSSYQTMPILKPYWSPVIAAPNKNPTSIRPTLPVSSSNSSSARWDWLLYSPQYYSEIYSPSSTFVHYQKIDEEETDGLDWNLLASLPTCLLALLYLTPTLIQTSADENDNDQELSSLHRCNARPLSPTSIEKKQLNLSSDNQHSLSNSNNDGPNNRSSTPDTDDGYQSASDASRSDYSHQSSIPTNLSQSNDDITLHERSVPTSLMPRRISYAAALKPTIPPSFSTATTAATTIGKNKQAMNHPFSNNVVSNDLSNSNGQKMKFIAPRFERMHHAKQYSSSNRTPIRTNNNNNQRNQTINSTRRR